MCDALVGQIARHYGERRGLAELLVVVFHHIGNRASDGGADFRTVIAFLIPALGARSLSRPLTTVRNPRPKKPKNSRVLG
jgi:hypothetical protein